MTDEEYKHLVDGKYGIKDLVDLKRLRKILEMFTNATGFTIRFIEHPNLNILIVSSQNDICTQYHRLHSISVHNCLQSNKHLLGQLTQPGQIVIEECENGLVDCATPVIIKGKHIASLATGQILLKTPDLDRFRQQAKDFGIDEGPYLEAVKQIPVLSESQLRDITGLLGEIASIISELGYASLEAKEESLRLKQEVAERKRAEEALRESEERVHFALEASHTGTWDLDLIDQTALQSIEHGQIFGYTDHNLLWSYKIFMKHVLPQDREMVERKFQHALENKTELSFECRIRRIDGAVRWILVVGRHKLEASGGSQHMVGIVQDITDRKKAEEELDKYRDHLEEMVKERTVELVTTREFLDRIINNIPSPIFVKDKDHRWILLNDAYCEFMGYRREELIGKSDFDFFPKEEAHVFWEKDQLVFDSGQININEENFTDAGGKLHIIMTKKVLFVQESTGEKVLVGIINDITELKNAYNQLQEALDKLVRSERLAALGEMAAMIGHELRNSLGVIRNSVYFLKLKLAKPSQEKQILKYLDILEEEVRISDKVISDILTFNRIKTPVLRKGDINAILTEELGRINFPIGIRKELDLDPSLPEIEVDVDQLRRVFANIVDNALDAMPDGGELLVKTFLQEAWFVVVFTDMGMGIPTENLSKIFKPGFTTKQHGSGLGLAICESVLGLHNGKIEVKSQVGKGTQVSIYLPYECKN